MARDVATAYFESRKAAGFPMAPEALRRELLQEELAEQGDA
jgi:glycyl-tRNA synthetase alpha chain